MPYWLTQIALSSWGIVLQAAPFILFGLIMAGFLYVYLPVNFARKAMGGSGLKAVLKAAAIGAPLPLCSCGVIPVALYLRKEGAGRGPVQSFLISTPETGVDSVAITYALLGPVMAVARPISALATAIVAGLGEKLFGLPEAVHVHTPGVACHFCDGRAEVEHRGDRGGPLGALRYAFVVLIYDLAPWLLIGLGLAGIIEGLVPKEFIASLQKHNILTTMLMIIVSMPMYMCATASTPIAAAFLAKGISPGAALAFLLAGPATNLSTMTAVGRFLGRRSLYIYLATIFGMSLLLGLALDGLLAAFGGSLAIWAKPAEHHHHLLPGWVNWASAIVFLLLLANGLRLRVVPYWLAWRDRRKPPEAAAGPAPRSDSEPAPGCCPGGDCAHRDEAPG